MSTRTLSCHLTAAQAAGIRSWMKADVWTLAAALVCCVSLQAAAAAVIYEPFAQTAGAINGKAASTTGLTGNWTATIGASAVNVVTPSTMVFGALAMSAGHANLLRSGNTNGRVTRSAALADAGLLANGAELWFSLILMKTAGGGNNEWSGFAFGSSYLTSGPGALTLQGGNGLGFKTRDANVTVATWNGTSTPSEGSSLTLTYNVPILIVGKINWGADDTAVETITLYKPSADLSSLGTGVSKTMAAVNQSLFTTISFSLRDVDTMNYDEIRFGATYDDVVGGARLYWDIDGATAGAGGATPVGTWDATTQNWNATSDGTGATNTWTAGVRGVFAAGTTATGAYTVTVDGTPEIGGLLFEEGTVTLTNGTALRMTSDAVVYVAAGKTATIATPFSEDATTRQLSKTGSGTLVLSGDNSAATGGMSLYEGITRFESPSSMNGSGRNVTVNPSGVVLFGSSFEAGNIATALGRITTASAGTLAADNYDATDFNFSTAGLTAASLGAVGTVNYTGTLTPNGTTYRLGGGGGTLTLNSALTSTYALDVKLGTVKLNGFDATMGAVSSATGSVLANGHAATAITLTANQSSSTTLAGTIVDGGTASLALAKSGSGTLTLNGNNSYSGGTTLSNGKIVASNNGAFGTGTITVTGNSAISGAYGLFPRYPNALHVNSGVTLTTDGSTQYWGMTFDGPVSGEGTIQIEYGGNDASTRDKLGLYSAANTFTGTLVNKGDDAFIAVNSLGDGGKIQLYVNDANTGGFVLNAGTASSLVFNTRQIELFGTSAIYNNNASASITFTINTALAIRSTGNKTFILRGSNTGNNTFSGSIADGNFNSAVQVISLLKEDGGKWILSGANTFTGTTTVNNGTLVLAAGTCLSDAALLTIVAGKKVQLNAGIRERVGSLVIGGVPKLDGVWGATDNTKAQYTDAVFTGEGLLYVNTPLPAAGTVIQFK